MKILIPLFSPAAGTWGSLTRTMAIAKYHQKKQDKVAFCASGFVADSLRAKGFEVYNMPEATFLGLPKFISKILVKFVENHAPPAKEGKTIGNIWLVYFMNGFLKKSYCLQLVKAEIEAVHKFHPDVILTEMDFAAYITAYITKIPLAITYAKIMKHGKGTFFWRRIKNVMNYVLNQYGKKEIFDPEDIAFHKNVLKIIPSIPELDTTNTAKNDICYAGNLIEQIQSSDTSFIPKTGKKYVFVYFGTASVSFEKAKKILPEVFQNYKDIICYAALHGVSENFSINNVNFVKFIPAEKLLPYCVLTICHGGLNTITQSIEAGVPLLIFSGPVFERHFNATMVQKTGAGFAGELSDFNVSWIREKFEKINTLKNTIYNLQKRFKEYKGEKIVYQRLRQFLNKTQAH
jgi:UDP:flavonoid glycosyltransferase YjiC (YdhE family)